MRMRISGEGADVMQRGRYSTILTYLIPVLKDVPSKLILPCDGGPMSLPKTDKDAESGPSGIPTGQPNTWS